MGTFSHDDDPARCRFDAGPEEDARRQAEELEDGSLDPDEPDVEPDWWDEGKRG